MRAGSDEHLHVVLQRVLLACYEEGAKSEPKGRGALAHDALLSRPCVREMPTCTCSVRHCKLGSVAGPVAGPGL